MVYDTDSTRELHMKNTILNEQLRSTICTHGYILTNSDSYKACSEKVRLNLMALKAVYFCDTLCTVFLSMVKIFSISQKMPKAFTWTDRLMGNLFAPGLKLYLQSVQTRFQISGMTPNNTQVGSFTNPFAVSPVDEIVNAISFATVCAIDATNGEAVKATIQGLLTPIISGNYVDISSLYEDYATITTRKTTRHLICRATIDESKSTFDMVVQIYKYVYTIDTDSRADAVTVEHKSSDFGERFIPAPDGF